MDFNYFLHLYYYCRTLQNETFFLYICMGYVAGAPYDVTVKRQDARNEASGANTEPVAGGSDTSSCQHSPNFQ